MNTRSWKILALLAAAGCLTVLIDYRWMTGWLLGCAVSVLTYKLTEQFCDGALRTGSSSGTMGHFMLNYLIWAAAMLICVFLPDLFQVIACAIGLMAVKAAVILESLIYKGR